MDLLELAESILPFGAGVILAGGGLGWMDLEGTILPVGGLPPAGGMDGGLPGIALGLGFSGPVFLGGGGA